MSVRALADKADVSVSYVYAIEAGARGSNITKLNQISDALDIALSELLGQDKRRE
jgi:transcriptional regulator with XRE-family HTH domain